MLYTILLLSLSAVFLQVDRVESFGTSLRPVSVRNQDRLMLMEVSAPEDTDIVSNEEDPEDELLSSSSSAKSKSIEGGIASTAGEGLAPPSASSSSSSSGTRSFLLKSAAGFLGAVSTAAGVGLIPGPDGNPYTPELIGRDVGTTLFCTVAGYTFVKVITWMASEQVLEPRDSRKVIHTLSAPLFMLLWPLYSPAGQWFALCTPLTNALRLYVAGKGDGETELAKAVSRSGDVSEAGQGPVIYCIVMFAAIALFWTKSLVGVVSLCTMAVGDGLADIVGRRLGKGNKWFFSKDKSIAGTVAFWVGATVSSVLLSLWFSMTGTVALPFALTELALRIALVTGLCAFIELLPFGDDNWNVPGAAFLLGTALLQ